MKFIKKSALALWSRWCLHLAKSESFSDSNRFPKIAIVKTVEYPDLFTKPSRKYSPKEVLMSSRHRSGPVGLIMEAFAKCIIVKTSSEPECQVFREKEHWKRDINEHTRRRRLQYEVAVEAESVDWGEFDLVVAIENAIPAKITRRYSSVLWATMLESHAMPSYRAYLSKAPAGYDLFFNQHFGPTPRRYVSGPHVIDWPYCMNRCNSVSRLFPQVGTRDGIVLESHQPQKIGRSIKRHWERVYRSTGDSVPIADHLAKLCTAKYFLSVQSSRSLWGNATIEAISAGCLVVGNADQLWNPFLIVDAASAKTLDEAADLIDRLENDPEMYKRIKTEQERRLDYFCWHRPLLQLERYQR
jgi:hypothetical protein